MFLASLVLRGIPYLST